MKVEHIDHIVLTVKNIDITCKFYSDALGMEVVEFGSNRKALRFGIQKINLHKAGKELEPKAINPTPGSADLCFITKIKLDEVIEHLKNHGIEVIEGPVNRIGAMGQIESIYFRDPDLNLVEISNYNL